MNVIDMKYIIGISIFVFLGLPTMGQNKMASITELKEIVSDQQEVIQWIKRTFLRILAEDTISKLQKGHPFILDLIEWYLPKDSIKKYLLFGVEISDAYAYISDDNKFSLFFVAELNGSRFEKIYSIIGDPDKEMGEECEDGIREFLEWRLAGNVRVSISLNIMANQLRGAGDKMYSIIVSSIEQSKIPQSTAPGVAH